MSDVRDVIVAVLVMGALLVGLVTGVGVAVWLDDDMVETVEVVPEDYEQLKLCHELREEWFDTPEDSPEEDAALDAMYDADCF